MSVIDVGDKLLQGLIKSSIIGAGMRKLRKWGAQNARWTPKNGYGSGGRLRTSRTQGRKGIKARPTFRGRGRSSLGFRRAARPRARSGKGKARVQKARLLATVDSTVAMDRFHERLTFAVTPASTQTDQQMITIGPVVGPGGIDMRLMKNLKETINGGGAAATADDPHRLLLYKYQRQITLHTTSSLGVQEIEMIRWRPRFDTDESPTQVFAFASAGLGDYKTVPLETFGSTLFDSRLWTTAMKAVKTYTVRILPGRSKKFTFKRTFKKPKVIDYLGEWYYTLASRPSGSFTDFQFYLKARLSEVITYRVKNTSLNGVGAGLGAGVYVGAPNIFVQDESTVHYLRANSSNISKSSFESVASTTPVNIASGFRYGIFNGYSAWGQPVALSNGVVGA